MRWTGRNSDLGGLGRLMCVLSLVLGVKGPSCVGGLFGSLGERMVGVFLGSVCDVSLIGGGECCGPEKGLCRLIHRKCLDSMAGRGGNLCDYESYEPWPGTLQEVRKCGGRIKERRKAGVENGLRRWRNTHGLFPAMELIVPVKGLHESSNSEKPRINRKRAISVLRACRAPAEHGPTAVLLK